MGKLSRDKGKADPKRVRAGRIAKEKGKRYERESARFFKRWFPKARRSLGQERLGGEHPDIIGTPYWIECKHVKGITADKIEKWVEKAEAEWTPQRVDYEYWIIRFKEHGRSDNWYVVDNDEHDWVIISEANFIAMMEER